MVSSLGAIVKIGYEEELGREMTVDEVELVILKKCRTPKKSVKTILEDGW